MKIVEKMHFAACIHGEKHIPDTSSCQSDVYNKNITLAPACSSDILNIKLPIHGGIILNQNVL